MTDLVELAERCRNPAVRNALLAAAAGRVKDDRPALCAARDAGRDALAARVRQAAFVRDALAAGRRGDPEAIDTAIDMMDAITDADARLAEARTALRAIRSVRETETEER